VALFEILDQSRVRGLPIEQPSREGTSRGHVDGEERCETTELCRSIVGVDRRDRNVEMTADDFGDHAGRHSLVVNRVQH
jgi:hypothetical protein